MALVGVQGHRDPQRAREGMDVVFNDTNADLRGLKRAGGKLLVYQGGNDGQAPDLMTGAHVDGLRTVYPYPKH
jgi:hypothetical protein